MAEMTELCTTSCEFFAGPMRKLQSKEYFVKQTTSGQLRAQLASRFRFYEGFRDALIASADRVQKEDVQTALAVVTSFLTDSVRTWRGSDKQRCFLPVLLCYLGCGVADSHSFFRLLEASLQPRVRRVLLLNADDCVKADGVLKVLRAEVATGTATASPRKKKDGRKPGDKARSHRHGRSGAAGTAQVTDDCSLDDGDSDSGSSSASVSKKEALVVVFQDLECFDRRVVNDVLRAVCCWRPWPLSVSCVFGLQTSVSSVSDVLSPSVLSDVSCSSFCTSACTQLLNKLFCLLFGDRDFLFRVDFQTLDLLTTDFLFRSFSLADFVKSFKLCMLEHFHAPTFGCACRIALDTSASRAKAAGDDLQSSVQRHRRTIPQAAQNSGRKRVDTSSSPAATVTDLGRDQVHLLRRLHGQQWAAVCCLSVLAPLCAYRLGKSHREVYVNVLDPAFEASEEWHQFFQLLAIERHESFVEKLRECCHMLNSSSSSFLPSSSFSCPSFCRSDVSELVEFLRRSIDDLERVDSVQQPGSDDSDASITDKTADANAPATGGQTVATRASWHVYKQKLKEDIRKMKTGGNGGEPSATPGVRGAFVADLRAILARYLTSVHKFPSYNVFYADQRQALQDMLLPANTRAIEAVVASGVGRTTDAAIMLSLLKSFSSRRISTRHWFHRFQASCCKASKAANSKHGTSENDDLVTRFFKVYAEFELVGYIQFRGRKNTVAHKLYWF